MIVAQDGGIGRTYLDDPLGGRDDALVRGERAPDRGRRLAGVGEAGEVDRDQGRGGGQGDQSVPGAEGLRGDSLKTEEKTKLVEPACQEDESCN